MHTKKTQFQKWLLGLITLIILTVSGQAIPLAGGNPTNNSHITSVVQGAVIRRHSKKHASHRRYSQIVYIAPRSRKKYHFSRTCRGLRRARGRITKMTRQIAISRGYKLCKWED